ncbi:MAG: metal-sensing transcriptional repressor [Bradyrhizobium sp.]
MPDIHSAIVRRLKRADGHLQMIIDMIEQGRPCQEIAQQLQAVEGAIENAKKALIQDHIGEWLETQAKPRRAAARSPLRDLKLIAKYL